MQTTKVYVANEDTMELQLMTQPIVDVATGDLYLKLDDVETLLTDIKANQTNGTQFIKVKNVAGTTINPATEDTLSNIYTRQSNGSQISKIGDRTVASRQAEVSYVSSLRTHEATRLVGTNINGATLDTNFWATTVAGSGGLAQANGQQTLTTGATADSTVQLQSVRSGRFLFACPNIYRGAIRLGDTGTANNVRRWGVFNANDGFFFQLNGSTFSLVCRRATSDANIVSSGSFNGSVSSYAINTSVHAYEIHYYVMQAEFYIDGVLIHTFTPTTTTLVGSLTLPITVQNNNSGGSTSNVTIESFNQSILRTGYEHHNPNSKRINTLTTTVCKYGAGNIHRVIVGAKGAGSSATIYDNTAASGTVLAVLDTSTNAQTYEFDLDFFTGLTVVTALGSAPDITVVYE